jgi:hypothetical protein
MQAAMALEIRVSLQRLFIGLIVVIVPLSILGLYLTSESNGNLRQAVGGHLRTIARTDRVVASQFIEDRIADVSAIAAEPEVLEAIQAANRSREHVSNEVISARTEKIEQQWDTGQVDSGLREILSSPASRWLRSQRNSNPRLLKVIVADESGVTVAATDKLLHYAQADEGYWSAVYAPVASRKPSAQTGTSTRQHSISRPGQEVWRVGVDRPQTVCGALLRIASVRAAGQSPAKHPCGKRLPRKSISW